MSFYYAAKITLQFLFIVEIHSHSSLYFKFQDLPLFLASAYIFSSTVYYLENNYALIV